MSFSFIAVPTRGGVAWVTTRGTFNAKAGGKEMQMPARATFVMERRDNA